LNRQRAVITNAAISGNPTTVSVPSSHASIVSHPMEVFELIQAAVLAGANRK
jgi:hypothetical protein